MIASSDRRSVEGEKRIVHACTYPGAGGAGIASLRLVNGLRESNVNATMLGAVTVDRPHTAIVEYSNSFSERIWRALRKRQLQRIDLAIGKTGKQKNFFASDLCPHGAALAHSLADADLIHLHWVCDLIDYPKTLGTLPNSVPIVWTLHDMGVFTGGCSHAFDCEGYMKDCAACPQLESEFNSEALRSLNRRKKAIRAIEDRLTIVAPSHWIGEKSSNSSLFRNIPHKVIANGIDLQKFHPDLRAEARKQQEFSADQTILLFVAAGLDTPLKGIAFLLEAIAKLDQSNFQVCFVGPESQIEYPQNWKWLGCPDNDQEIASIYAAADLLVVPSLADNFPNVICEALACGLPVVGSNVGGIPELVIENETGFLAEPADSSSLSRVLSHAITTMKRERNLWLSRCRSYAEKRLGIHDCVDKHRQLYEQVLTANSR
ncbi:glycosyltransferase, group 1 family protein [Rhodopirellula sallentina SM41]|uniref:Glycosyltransferase, group 1 family protein n=1 Tax=Rhodopirellula sallentina SM41 TaxID=1263870 RepID=M5U8J0_9BACT|nr:glycosyltransferase, group 1 family protein [Rhodopirellula sallentina SM41]